MTRIAQLTCLIASALLLTAGASAQGRGGGGGGGGPPGGPGGRPADIGRGGGFGGAERPAFPETRPAREMPARELPARPDLPESRRQKAETPESAKPARDLADAMRDFNRTGFEERRRLLRELDMSDQSSRERLKEIQRDARTLRGEAREEFKTALEDVKNRQAEIRAARKAALNADEKAWDKARESLERAYGNYAAAMARLEARRAERGEKPPEG